MKLIIQAQFILLLLLLNLFAPANSSEILSAEKENGISHLENSFLDQNNNSAQQVNRLIGLQRDVNDEETNAENEYDENFGFVSVVKRCVRENGFKITENFTRGKNIIFSCFKAAVVLNFLKYLVASSKPSVKFFNGILEFEKIPLCDESENENDVNKETCLKDDKWQLDSLKGKSEREKHEYLYRRMVQKLVDRDNGTSGSDKNFYANNIDKFRNNLLVEVVQSFLHESAEKAEEEKLVRDLSDPILISVLNEFYRNFMLRINFHSNMFIRMQRSFEGEGITVGVETEVPSKNEASKDDNNDVDEPENESSYEFSARSDHTSREGRKGDKSKKGGGGNNGGGNNGGNNRDKRKEKRKKRKEQKDHFTKHLILPFTIQLALLPLVLKNLFFLAIKALFAGKAALILIVYNLLKNAKIENEDAKIRVEHYGYKSGEEYGAWINGRQINSNPSIINSLNELPYWGQQSVVSK